MKLLRLDLRAFGPFTDRKLDLSGGNEGLHIIYGPNEAGKSSALRALTAFLYDIPERTRDGFVHPNPKLRIGGVLRKKDGTELAAIRRKARKSPLRGPDDETPVDEAELNAFLGGVDAESFEAMFGIDHGRLVAGGREIVRGGGRVGELLFAAGAGLGDFRRIRDALVSEANELFQPRAQKPAVNAAISAFLSVRKAVSDARLPAEDWERHDRALRAAETEKEAVVAELTRRTAERHGKARIRDALPLIVRRDELRAEYEPLRSAPILSEDFEDRSRAFGETLRLAENRVKASAEKRERLGAARADLIAPDGLADHADTVAELFQDAGFIRKAARDRVNLETARDRHETEARDLLAELRPDSDASEPGEIRLNRMEIRRIRDLATEHERLVAGRDSARDSAGKLERRLARERAELAEIGEPADLSDLAATVERVRERGDVAGERAAAEAEVEAAGRAVNEALARLPFWSGDLAALESAGVPSVDAVEGFETDLREAAADVARALEAVEEGAGKRDLAEAELHALGMDGEIPTEADLDEARNRRDAGWRLVRRALEIGDLPEGAAEDFIRSPGSGRAPAETLAEAVEAAMVRADGIADRLRREADRVARKAGLMADRHRLNQSLERARSTAADAHARQAALLRDWNDLWRGAPLIPGPGSPREMRNWLGERDALLTRAAGWRDRIERAERLRAVAAECRDALVSALSEAGGSVGETTVARLLARASKLLSEREAIRNRRENLRSGIRDREAELDEVRGRAEAAESTLERWRERWAEAVRPLGLDPDATPDHAAEVMDAYRKYFEHRKEAAGLSRRLEGIDRDAEAFAARVSAFLAREAPDLADAPPEAAVDALNARLAEARRVRTERNGVEKQIREEEATLEKARRAADEARAALESLCAEVGCVDPEGLIPAARRSRRRAELESVLAELEARLCDLAAGATLPEFVETARDADPNELEAEMEALEETIRELEGRRSVLDQTIGTERAERARMDGGDEAAVLQAEAESILARMATDVERYARLRLASAVLDRAVERYRRKSQGPVLGRARELFSRMTLGRFIDARVDDAGDGDELVGVRESGEAVRMIQMSDGTADQLFLAVRLAGLEAYNRRHEPMPFVADDILVQFDDDRARATLAVLAELSRETQVIFFTHHRHLAALAREAGGDAVRIHALGDET